MRKLLFSIVILLFSTGVVSAQVFPVFEDFELYPDFSVPTPFSGDVQVVPLHGTNTSKGLAANITSTNQHDSIITPVYGPIDGGSVLLYEWRFASATQYPTQTISLVPGDSFETYITTDGINYQLVASVDNSNYFPDTMFQTNSVQMGQFGGSNIQIKFVIHSDANPEAFWLDIDNIFIFDITSVSTLTRNDISFYPTIVNDRLSYSVTKPVKAAMEIYSMEGKKIKTERLESESSGSIDLSALVSGNYILRIAGNSNITYRFTKR
jgi:hypothetical protein